MSSASTVDAAAAAGGPAGPGRPRLSVALIWSYVLSAGGFAINGVLTFVLAAILNPRAYGVIALGLVWVLFVQTLLQVGPTLAVIQHEDVTDEHYDVAFWTMIVGAVLLGGVFAALSPLWAAYNSLPELVPVCLALAPLVLIRASVVIPDAILRRAMQMRVIAIRGLLAAAAGGVAGIAFAVAGFGVWALVAQQVTNEVVYAVILWTVTRWRPRLRWSARALRDLRGTSVNSLLSSLGVFGASRADALVMGAYFVPQVLGLYRFALRLPQMVVDVTARGTQQVALPDLSRHGHDPAVFAHRLSRLIHVGVVLGFPLLGVLAGVTRPLLGLIGDQWDQAVVPMRVLCAVSAVGIFGTVLGPALQAAGRAGLQAAHSWASAFLFVGAVVFAAHMAPADTLGQLLTVSWIMLAVESIVIAALTYLTVRYALRVPARLLFAPAVPASLAAVAGGVAGWGVDHLVSPAVPDLVALLAAGIVATATAGLLLYVADPEVAGRVRRLLRRQRHVGAHRVST
jgi:PST family polysaccharide transporter